MSRKRIYYEVAFPGLERRDQVEVVNYKTFVTIFKSLNKL